MKQIFRRGGIILSVLVLALIFSSCSPLAIRSQSSKISLTLPSASDVRRAFGPEAITSYMVGINSDSTGERCYDEVVDAGEHLEAEVPAGDYTVIIIGMEGLEANPGSYMLSGLAKQSGIKVLPNETTEVALKMVPLTITSNIPHRVEGKNPWTGAELPVISNEGYTFDGWYANNDPSAFLTQFPDTEKLTEVTITAKWTAKNHGIEGLGFYDNSGNYSISVTSISDESTKHTGNWEDPIPLNQLTAYLPDGKIPYGTVLYLQNDLSGMASLNALFAVIQDGVTFDGNYHTVTLGTIQTYLPIGCNFFISNLTITGGTTGGTGPSSVFRISSTGSLKLYNCTISKFTATGSNAKGGAIYNEGKLEFGESTIDGCSASLGAGIYCAAGSSMTIYDSTITNCTGTAKGNSIYLEQNVTVNTPSNVSANACWINNDFYPGDTDRLLELCIDN